MRIITKILMNITREFIATSVWIKCGRKGQSDFTCIKYNYIVHFFRELMGVLKK